MKTESVASKMRTNENIMKQTDFQELNNRESNPIDLYQNEKKTEKNDLTLLLGIIWLMNLKQPIGNIRLGENKNTTKTFKKNYN